MTFAELRKKYPLFVYEGFSFVEKNGVLEIEYQFTIEGLTTFKPKWVIKNVNNTNREDLNQLIFSLGMVELVSYWKPTCSPLIKI